MKTLVYIVLVSLCMGSASAQTQKAKAPYTLPNWLMNLDFQFPVVGFSVSELKAVIGSKNTGILIGIGRSSDKIDVFSSAKLGYQLGIVRGLYSNICLNRIAQKDIELKDKVASLRLNLGLGYTVSIGKKKRFYLSFETAYSILNIGDLSPSRLSYTSGIGFRIGTPATTTYEGVNGVGLSAPVK